MASFQVLPPTDKHMLDRLTGDSKLAVGVNGCPSLSVSPVKDWRVSQGGLHNSELDQWEVMDG